MCGHLKLGCQWIMLFSLTNGGMVGLTSTAETARFIVHSMQCGDFERQVCQEDRFLENNVEYFTFYTTLLTPSINVAGGFHFHLTVHWLGTERYGPAVKLGLRSSTSFGQCLFKTNFRLTLG